MQLNFNYDKVIITKYLIGGGGKILCACLGLSDDAVLMRKDLAQMQLDGKLPIEKKLKYLLLATKEQSKKQIWDDWGLYDNDFWGVQEEQYTLNDPLFPGSGTREYIINRINKVVYDCIDNNKFMLNIAHSDVFLIPILNYWKNSKVIIFKNESEFRLSRKIKDFWPKRKILNFARRHIDNQVLFDSTKYDNQLYEWDCDWYFSKNKTVDEIEKLYDSFGLSGFNSEMISEFYDSWIEANLQ